MSGNNSQTPREKLEAETRIISRSSRTVYIAKDGETAQKVVQVRPLSYTALEDLTGDIAKLISNFFAIAIKAMALQRTGIPFSEGLDTHSAGAEELGSEAPAEGDVTPEFKIKPEMGELFKPETFIAIASKFTDIIKRLVEAGTDASWEDIREYDFTVGIRLALEVLRYNIGPELRSFFAKDVSAVLGDVVAGVAPKTAPETATSD